jgi:chromosome partitioning protein
LPVFSVKKDLFGGRIGLAGLLQSYCFESRGKTMRVIAIVNQKGGCGKTTVSINLASALAEAGQRTLLVDMDPQSHCAVGLAVPEEQIEQSVYDVLISKSRNEPIRLMAGITERENCLKNILDEVRGEYDYVVVDCPPAVGLLTFNALRAATNVIVPVETGYFALHGLSKQLETLSILCERCDHHVNVRVLASMYDVRTKMAREILAELRNHFSDKMFRTTVNFNTKIKEASSFGQPISEYDPASKGQADFRALAEEMIASGPKRRQRHELVNSLAGQLESISSSADELLRQSKPAVKAAPAAKTERPLDKAADSGLAERMEKLNAEPATGGLNADKDIDPAPRRGGVDAKLSDYYGVSQISDAVVFVTLYPRAGNVQIAGDFNNWQPTKTSMEKVGKSGVWQSKLKLPAGKYRYRLVVDGQWQQDPYNELTELNPFGGFNSVVEVK